MQYNRRVLTDAMIGCRCTRVHLLDKLPLRGHFPHLRGTVQRKEGSGHISLRENASDKGALLPPRGEFGP